MAARVQALNDYESYSAPSRKGPYVFFRKNAGLQDQSVLYIQKGLDGTPEVLHRSERVGHQDQPGAAHHLRPSKDAKYAVYGISPSGSDWQEYHVMELATKKTLADTLAVGQGLRRRVAGRRVLLQPLSGAGQAKAKAGDQREPSGVLPQGRHAAVAGRAGLRTIPPTRSASTSSTRPTTSGSRSCRSRSAARARTATRCSSAISRAGDKDFKPVSPTSATTASTWSTTSATSCWWRPTRQAPNGRVVLVDPQAAGGGELEGRAAASGPSRCEGVNTAGGKLFATYLKDVTTRAYVHALDGRLENEIALPGPRHGGRLRRRARQHLRVLHVQFAERAADDLPLRHRDEEDQRVPPAEGPRLRPGGVRDQAGLLHRARTARRCRCSSSIARA